jgi:excisionase family DNA binding protein
LIRRLSVRQLLTSQRSQAGKPIIHPPKNGAGAVSDVSVSNMTFLSPKQVADMLGVSKATVSRWAAQDATFPATRLPGRLVRIEEQALHRWLRRKSGRNVLQVPDSLTPAPDERSGECTSGGMLISPTQGVQPKTEGPPCQCGELSRYSTDFTKSIERRGMK